MKNTGIWIDRQQAHLVYLEDQHETLETVNSEVEFLNPRGGSRSKTRWGPQQVVHDSKYTAREKQQLQRYYQDLATRLADSGKVVLYGPAGTNTQFKRYLEDCHPLLAARVRDVFPADSMTENQFRALVREYYNS
ncbi:hypothetical protein OZ410_08985 [Robiginitalea sp. M366]|uniref:hypothetical protein n=1 Tax=Robiginitalea aestuariiviva TaxID=3036903 RepID=UPI00240E975A|nr:hypothetical protein [Robiginitalea aestuariiviva]MDG1572448.1 hypothetical protein [Robiginitalea aestuariiviva]